MVEELCCQLCSLLSFGLIGFIILCALSLIIISPKIVQSILSRQVKANRSKLLQRGLSDFLSEICICNQEQQITKHINSVKAITRQILALDVSKETKARCIKIQAWSESFSIQKHLNDLLDYGFSKQISFDSKMNDFRFSGP